MTISQLVITSYRGVVREANFRWFIDVLIFTVPVHESGQRAKNTTNYNI